MPAGPGLDLLGVQMQRAGEREPVAARRPSGQRTCASGLLSFASPLHLYAEEIEPRTGRHLGNFPQAFTHLALINAVVHVIRAEEEADSSGVFVPANAPMSAGSASVKGR